MSWLHALRTRRTAAPRRPAPRIEPLEARIAPATFAGTGGPSLDITLDHSNEAIFIISNGATYTVTSNFFETVDGGQTGGHVSGFTTQDAVIDANAFTTIHIKNTATSNAVTFIASGANVYTSAFDIVLDDPTVGTLTFAGASNFAGSLIAKVTGSITQTAPVVSQSSAGVSLTSTGGAVTLTDPANNFSKVSLETSDANDIALRTSATLALDHITTETGNLTITAGAGIGQTAAGRIDVGGTTTFDITGGANVSLQLASAANFFGGPVIITESNGDVGSISLRNISPTATLPNLTDLSTGDLNNLQLVFDGTGIVLDSATLTKLAANGQLTVVAGGPITQTAPINLGFLTVNATGNHGITLTNPGNLVTNTVNLFNSDADGGAGSAVTYVETGGITLGLSSLGLGTLSITALTGDITQTGPITQQLGAGTASFTATAGTSINLGNQANTFAGAVQFIGAAVTSVQLRDGNTLAALPNLADVTDTLTGLTLTFDNAPIVLPSYIAPLQNLTVAADGIYQQPGSHLVLSGVGDFNSSTFKLDLSNADNDFGTLHLRSTGREDVHVVDANAVAFGGGNSDVGTGRLTISAGGAITQSANRIRQAAGAGPASFTAPSITLDRPQNDFTGEVLLISTGGATLVDTNSVILGKVAVEGNLSVNAGSNITQLAGSLVLVKGTTTLTSGGGANVITVDNPGNGFQGALQLSGGNVTLRSTGAVTFTGANNVASLEVTTDGAITQQAGSAIVVIAAASFDAGTSLIDLNLGTNDFKGVVSATSTASVALADLSAILIGDLKLGAAAFTVNASGFIFQASGTSITQTGPGALSFLGGDVTLNQPNNNFLGPVSVDANSVNITAVGDLTFSGASDIDGDLTVIAGGTLRLPTIAANLNDLGSVNVLAARTIISTNLATDSGTGLTLHGAVQLASGITINTSANNGIVTFDGDVNPLGSLTFNVGTAEIDFVNGTWNQGVNNLTITTTGQVALGVGGIAAGPSTFAMSGGTLTLNVAAGGTALEVFAGGSFQVGSTAGTAEFATINTGAVATTVQFDAGSSLQVGFGATNDKLVVNTVGQVVLADARLIGSGVAGASLSPVLDVTGGGILSGTFHDSLALDGTPQPFLAGSDIVTAGFLPSTATIGTGPVSAASFSGFLPDGDKYTVTHSAGAAAGLVVIQNSHGQIDIAVRTNAAAGTLNIVTTKFSGDGLTDIGGIGINGPGAITINAATSNLHADLRVENALTALTIRDVADNTTASQPQLIHAGGAASASTSITGHLLDGVTIELGSALNTFKVAEFTSSHSATEPAQITAERFGTLTVTGDAATRLTGNFDGRLTDRNSLHSPMALGSFTADELSGHWDLAGSVGSVTVKQTTIGWTLGATGPGAVNFHGLTSTGNLSLANASSLTGFVTGSIAGLKATNLVSVTVTAGSIGTFSAVADPAHFGQFGDVVGLNLTLTGNVAGMAVKTFSVAASLTSSTLHFLDGNVGAFTVGRELRNSFLMADATTAGGRFNAFTVGRWNNTDVDAKSIGTLKVISNAIAGELGDLVNSDFTLSGQAAGLGIGTLSATGFIDSSNFILRAGGMTSFTAARGLSNSNITLFDAALGNVKTVTVALWNNNDLTARTIGTLKVTGAAQLAPASPLLVGDLTNTSALLAFVDSGTTPAIGTLAIAGSLNASTVTARHGITTLTVARSFGTSTVVADDVVAGQLAVGRIGTLTVGQWTGSVVAATTLGKVSVTGYIQQEGTVPVQFQGSISGGTLLANGATPSGAKSGIDSLSVAGSLSATMTVASTVTARSGLGSLTVRDIIQDTTLTFDDPLNLAGSGKVGKVSVGRWTNTTIRANVLTTLQTIPSGLNFAFGDFKNATVGFAEVTVAGSSGAATDPIALTTFSIAGDMSDTAFNIPAGVKTFKVAGAVADSDLAAGFGANARIASITAGAWDNTDLTTRVLSAMNVTGNAPRGIAGNITDSLLTIMGHNTGVGLGTLVAQGTVSNTTVQITDGSVTSFTVGKFLDSNLFAGFRAGSTVDFTQGGTFGATHRTIALFKTTQAFDPTDPDSVSFHNSTVVAANLGAITLTGVDTAADRPIIFGIGFETGGTAGVVKADVGGGAGLVTQTAPFTSGDFTYKGL